MTRFIALLRGINVGGSTNLPMAELRSLLAGLGYTGVRTLLRSGNAVFTAPDTTTATTVAAAVEAALADAYGRDIKVVVRTADELRAVVGANPLAVDHPARFLVTFYAEPIDHARAAGVDTEARRPEEMALAEREIYYSLPGGLADARLPVLVERALKVTGTGRNWNTVTKLVALTDET